MASVIRAPTAMRRKAARYAAALRILEKCKPHINAFEVLQGTMDDAFIGITGKELRQ
jgi:hypothetical protein